MARRKLTVHCDGEIEVPSAVIELLAEEYERRELERFARESGDIVVAEFVDKVCGKRVSRTPYGIEAHVASYNLQHFMDVTVQRID